MAIEIPVITIDGPAGVGKGTLSTAIASALKWHRLESGALYRLVALISVDAGLDIDALCADDQSLLPLLDLIKNWNIVFNAEQVMLANSNVTQHLRDRVVEQRAAILAKLPAVRSCLLDYQRSCKRAPGLVAEGRDMGTVVFADAPLKIFLTADVNIRAHRRYLQLQLQNKDVKIKDLLIALTKRDKSDKERISSPLKPADDALLIDSTDMSAQAVINATLAMVHQKGFAQRIEI